MSKSLVYVHLVATTEPCVPGHLDTPRWLDQTRGSRTLDPRIHFYFLPELPGSPPPYVEPEGYMPPGRPRRGSRGRVEERVIPQYVRTTCLPLPYQPSPLHPPPLPRLQQDSGVPELEGRTPTVERKRTGRHASHPVLHSQHRRAAEQQIRQRQDPG